MRIMDWTVVKYLRDTAHTYSPRQVAEPETILDYHIVGALDASGLEC